jgi:hypothetical protein
MIDQLNQQKARHIQLEEEAAYQRAKAIANKKTANYFVAELPKIFSEEEPQNIGDVTQLEMN